MGEFSLGIAVFGLVIATGLFYLSHRMWKARNTTIHDLRKYVIAAGVLVFAAGILWQPILAAITPSFIPHTSSGFSVWSSGGVGAPTGSVVTSQNIVPSVTSYGLDNCPESCPFGGTSDLTIDLQNTNNGTTEPLDRRISLFRMQDGKEAKFAEITDTTSATHTDAPCGRYRAKIQATSGNGGNNSMFDSLIDSTAPAAINDGYLDFCAVTAGTSISARTSKHAALEITCTNKFGTGLYDEGDTDASNTDYETTGVQFHGTTNATNTTVNQGGNYQATCYIRATSPAVVSSPRGFVLGLDMASGTWKEPSLKGNGATLTNVKSSMDEYENLEYGSIWEYMYRVTDFQITANNEFVYNINANALASQDPGASHFINTTLVEIADYESNKDGATIKSGFVTDDDNHNAVQGLFSWTLGMA